MKKFIGLLFLFISFSLAAQIAEPVRWSATVKKLDDAYLAVFIKATLDSGWHIYSQHLDKGGPVKTTIQLKDANNKEIAPLQWMETGDKEKFFDSSFGMDVIYFSHEAVFAAKIPIANAQSVIKASVNYMVCNSEFCLPPSDESLSLSLNNLSLLPKATTADLKVFGDVSSSSVKENSDAEKSQKGLWGIFFTAFLGGLAALLTPCVFPIVPLTVSYFTKRNTTKAKGIRQALSYGLSIIIIYVSLGYGVTALFGIDALNSLATNVWVNLAFFLLLVTFAISFLGAFDIRLPSSFINKVDTQSSRSGFAGIFFMAFTLALVSFSCTGPIIGTLLFQSAISGNIKGPLVGMTGFSVAMALPFTFFAAFPGWLKSLPKSGNWMNSVKVVLGLLELALAIKFLSNADLVFQLGIVTREVFIALWIAIFAVLTFYLLGFIRFPHDDANVKSISVFRGLFAVLTLAFTLYLIPGLWGAPLKIISGFPPPDFYREWKQQNTQALNQQSSASINDNQNEDCPNNLNCFHDYDEALAYSKASSKPLLIDFTGWACVNCRKMEGNVWTDPQVDKLLREEVVLASLYVDDKRPLPDEERTTKKLGEKDFTMNTIGNKWSYFQASRFHINSQPYNVLEDPNENVLGVFEGYHPSVTAYLEFLRNGIAGYKKSLAIK